MTRFACVPEREGKRKLIDGTTRFFTLLVLPGFSAAYYLFTSLQQKRDQTGFCVFEVHMLGEMNADPGACPVEVGLRDGRVEDDVDDEQEQVVVVDPLFHRLDQRRNELDEVTRLLHQLVQALVQIVEG